MSLKVFLSGLGILTALLAPAAGRGFAAGAGKGCRRHRGGGAGRTGHVSLENVGVAREDIASAGENLRITDLKYKEGLQRQLDLLSAISNLTRAQSNYVAVVRTVFENYFGVVRMIEGFPVTP